MDELEALFGDELFDLAQGGEEAALADPGVYPQLGGLPREGSSRKQTSVTSMPRERLRSREWTCVFAPPVSPPLMRCITFKFRPPVILVTGGDLL